MWSQVQASPAIAGSGCPLIRSKHAMCFTDDGHIYLYGGRSLANAPLRDLWRFDTHANQWEEISVPRHCSTSGSCAVHLPTSISFHGPHGHGNYATSSRANVLTRSTTLDDSRYVHSPESSQNSESCETADSEPPPSLQEHTIVAADQRLYVFGGQVGFANDDTPLWTFDLQDSSWRKFNPRLSNATSRPIGRRGHSAVLYHSLMAIYGGYQDLKGSLSELWILDLETEEWRRETDVSHPPKRHAHTAVVYRGSMFVYGGMTDLQVRSDFWAWHFKSRTWSRIKSMKNPGQLCCHSAIVVNDSMFIYGGQKSKGKPVNELWHYRFDTETWAQISISGLVPGCRTQHVAVANPFITFYHHQQAAQNAQRKVKSSSLKILKKSRKYFSSFEKSPELTKHEIVSDKSAFKITEENDEEKENCISDANLQVQVKTIQVQPEESNSQESQCRQASQAEVEVKLRQRPVLQRQRPYSDVASGLAQSAIAEEIFQAWRSNKLNAERSVEESMSYYSLCFPTPQKLPSPPKELPLPVKIEPIEVKRRENTEDIRTRIRRANLELKELNTALRGPDKHPASWHPQNTSAYYSLSLDISPDYEKELNFRCSEESSPVSSASSNPRPAPSHAARDLDILEDYLEPEEMLEIVHENSSYKIRDNKLNQTPRHEKGRKQSVSHSSSGYQSLILVDSSDEATSGSPLSLTQDHEILRDLKATLSKSIGVSAPVSTSEACTSGSKLPSEQSTGSAATCSTTTQTTFTPKTQSPETHRPPPPLPRHSSWKRLSNWKPNIREVIKEVIVPSSPTITRSQSPDSGDSSMASSLATSSPSPRRKMFFQRNTFGGTNGSGSNRKQKRIETGRNEHRKRSKLSILLPAAWRSRNRRNTQSSWRLCMYVFGGRESDSMATSALHRQPITIWKFYI